jgi:hypothetical protein
MFLGRIIDWIEEFAPVPDTVDQREVKARSRIRLARLRAGDYLTAFAYNGTVRLREGRQVSIDIRNDTDIDDIIRWHGLYAPDR